MSSHIGQELAYMLAGTKPLAGFAQEAGMERSQVVPDGFDKAVAQGRLMYQVTGTHITGSFHHYFSLPDEAWRMRVMARYDDHDFLSGKGHAYFSYVDDQRFRGYMYGYAADDVEIFVERSAHRMHAMGALHSDEMNLRNGPGRLPGKAGIIVGLDLRDGRTYGVIHPSNGHPLTLSFHHEERWRAELVVGILNDKPRWSNDLQRRDDHLRLLRFAMDADEHAVEALLETSGIRP